MRRRTSLTGTSETGGHSGGLETRGRESGPSSYCRENGRRRQGRLWRRSSRGALTTPATVISSENGSLAYAGLGTPADPPTFRAAVPNWKPGDTIPLGAQRKLRVVRVRDDDADQAPGWSSRRRSCDDLRRTEREPLAACGSLLRDHPATRRRFPPVKTPQPANAAWSRTGVQGREPSDPKAGCHYRFWLTRAQGCAVTPC
jgi:hypothetical protein